MIEKIADDCIYNIYYEGAFWKRPLLALLEEGEVNIPRRNDNSNVEKYLSYITGDEKPPYSELGAFIRRAGGKLEDFDETNKNHHMQIIYTIERSFERLNELGLIEINDTQDDKNIKYYAHKITEKGLDVSIRLQEHIDNDRRFLAQKEISDTLKRNSTVSLYISVTAILVALTTLFFSYQRLKLMEDRVLSEINVKLHNKEESKGLPIEKLSLNEKSTLDDKATGDK